MTLIDTACVGRAADILQLAALGPNTVIFNVVNYGFTFMGIATLSVVAQELAEGSRAGAERAMSHAAALALGAGSLAAATMCLLAEPLVTLGGAAAGAPFFQDAVAYLRIRALSAPAMLLTTVLQSALLAQQESRAPAAAVLAASVVNVVGDLLLVCMLGLGAAGAAWATVLSEVAAAGFLFLVLPQGGRLALCLRSPRPRDLAPFAALFGPLVVFKVAKNICYGMLQSAATSLGTLEAAAHQSVWVLWMLFSWMPEPLSQAAQALLPARFAAAEAGGAWQQRALRETMGLLQWASFLVGLVLAVGAGILPACMPWLLARDRVLWASMTSVAVPSALSTLLGSLSCPLEGALLARRDVRYMALCMTAILATLSLGLRGIRERQNTLGATGLPLVWWWLCAFFTLRLGAAIPRLQWMVRFPGKEL